MCKILLCLTLNLDLKATFQSEKWFQKLVSSPESAICCVCFSSSLLQIFPKSLSANLTNRKTSWEQHSWFALTSYQNSEALKNRFRFQNIHGIVESLKLHIWTKAQKHFVQEL